jgi:hypothetical protein
MNEVTGRLNVDNRFNYYVSEADFHKINEGYLPKKIWVKAAGATLKAKPEYYENITRRFFEPTWGLKAEYMDTHFEGLTHEFLLESIFDENGVNKGFIEHMKMLETK